MKDETAALILIGVMGIPLVIILSLGTNLGNVMLIILPGGLLTVVLMSLIYMQRKKMDNFLALHYPSATDRERFYLPFKTFPLINIIMHSGGFTILLNFLYLCSFKSTASKVLDLQIMFVLLFLVDVFFIIRFIRRYLIAGAAIIDKHICIWENVFKSPNKNVPFETIEEVNIYAVKALWYFKALLDISCNDGNKYRFAYITNLEEIHNRIKTENAAQNYSMKIMPDSIDDGIPVS